MSDNQEFDEGEIIEEEILVGKWDCDNCETLGNDGDSYDCNGCGAPRSEDVQFYLGDSPRLVEDKAGIDAANAGLDWYCTFCDSGNSNVGDQCDNCGAKKGSARHHKIKITAKSQPKEEPVVRAPVRRRTKRFDKPPFPKGLLIAGFLALPFLFFCLAGLLFTSSGAERAVSQKKQVVTSSGRVVDEYPAKLVALSWTRKIKIEQWQWVKESAWSLPRRGEFEVLAKKKEFHHFVRVLDRYETEAYKEAYSVKTGQRRVRTGWKKVQDGTKRAQVGTRKVVAGKKRIITGYKNVRNGTKKVQTGTRRVKTGREKVVTGRKRVIKRYKTTTKVINKGNGRFSRKTIRTPVYGYENTYGYRDRYRQEPVYRDRPAYRKEPIYGEKTLYKDEAVYGDVPKYKQEAVFGMEDVFETRYRDKTRQVPIYKKVPVQQTKFYYRAKRWFPYRVEQLNERNRSPRWPIVELEKNERVSEKLERYTVHFEVEKDGETVNTTIKLYDEQEWADYS
ncbi:MAG: hypothetical protein P1V97_36045, partial [Planctomycetota bacterium]|nr:hypothetical protein [Planctomycetota bacterium]